MLQAFNDTRFYYSCIYIRGLCYVTFELPLKIQINVACLKDLDFLYEKVLEWPRDV